MYQQKGIKHTYKADNGKKKQIQTQGINNKTDQSNISKQLVEESLAFLQELPNTVDFLHKEKFLDQLTILNVCEKIYSQQQNTAVKQGNEKQPIKKQINLSNFQNNLRIGSCEEVNQNKGNINQIKNTSNNNSLLSSQSLKQVIQDMNQESTQKSLSSKASATNIQQQPQQNNSPRSSSARNISPKNSEEKMSYQTALRKMISNKQNQQLNSWMTESTLNNTNTPLTFGTSQRFERPREKSPGPSDYNTENAQRIIMSNTPKMKIPNSKRLNNQNHSNSPGPGDYYPSFRFISK